MSWISGLFGRQSGSKAPLSAPVPEGEWRIIVDKDCRIIKDRPAQPGDMLARTPVPCLYGGTVPGFTADRRQDEIQNMARRVEYEVRASQNKALFEQAVFILSQTADGRRLLQRAHNEKFTFIFDPERMTRENALGMCDYQNKLIPLAEGRTPEQVALTIKHELQHMEDIRNGAGAYCKLDTIESATIANRGLEANARVSEAVFAMEAMSGDPRGPAQQFKSYAIMAQFHQKNPQMGAAALLARKQAEQNDAAGWAAFGNAVFPAYYKETGTLGYYDDRLAKLYGADELRSPDELREAARNDPAYRSNPRRIEDYIKSIKDGMAGLMKISRVTAEDLKATLTIRGLKYLSFDKKFDPASESARGLTERGIEMFGKLAKKLEDFGITTDDPNALKNLPRHTPPLPVKGLGREFAEALSAIPEEKFEPIVMPYRMDGAKDTRGQAEYAYVTDHFTNYYNKPHGSTSPLDKIEFAVTDWIHHNQAYGNLRGRMRPLLAAGLRAPICAFPPEYTFDLAQRMRGGARHDMKPGDNLSGSFSPEEIELIAHWQELDRRGFSPLWLDEQHNKNSWYGADSEKMIYADILLKGISTKAQSEKAPGEEAGLSRHTRA